MLDRILERLPRLKKRWNRYRSLFTEISVPARTVLLKEGDVARKLYFVKEGCLRACFNHHGREITFQFFLENEFVASIESFRTGQPSPISIKSIEPSTVIVLQKKGFDLLLKDFPEIKDLLLETALRRFAHYARLFLSYIRDTPKQRYAALLKDNPEIIRRIPQHFIASYLGITPVSLSRIRKRL